MVTTSYATGLEKTLLGSGVPIALISYNEQEDVMGGVGPPSFPIFLKGGS